MNFLRSKNFSLEKRLWLSLILGGLMAALVVFMGWSLSLNESLSFYSWRDLVLASMEEASKYLVAIFLYVIYRDKINFYEVIFIGAGFAFMENLFFIKQFAAQSGTLWSYSVIWPTILRFIGPSFMHVITMGFLGIILLYHQNNRKWNFALLIFLSFLLSTFVHYWFNYQVVNSSTGSLWIFVWILLWFLIVIRDNKSFSEVSRFSGKYFGLIFAFLVIGFMVARAAPPFGPLEIRDIENALETTSQGIHRWSGIDKNNPDIERLIGNYKLANHHLSSILSSANSGHVPNQEDSSFWESYNNFIGETYALESRVKLNKLKENRESWLERRNGEAQSFETKRKILVEYFDELIVIQEEVVKLRETNNTENLDKLEKDSLDIYGKISDLAKELNNPN